MSSEGAPRANEIEGAMAGRLEIGGERLVVAAEADVDDRPGRTLITPYGRISHAW
jgi:hypothetical protein